MPIRFSLSGIAAALMMASVALPANAASLRYTLSLDAIFTYVPRADDVIAISGGFVWDTDTKRVTEVTIKAACTGQRCPLPMTTSSVDFNIGVSSGSTPQMYYLIAKDPGVNYIEIKFNTPSNPTQSVIQVRWIKLNNQEGRITERVRGTATTQ